MFLMIDNYDSFTFNLVQLFGVHGVEMTVVRNDAISVEDIRDLSPKAVVLSPGPCTPDQAGVSLAVVRALLGQTPMFGVCLGHQAIVQGLGGSIVRAQQLVHGKTSPIHHDALGIFAGLKNPFQATRYHSLIVEATSLPKDLQVTARTADGGIMAIRHRTALCVGVQFHPESVLTPTGGALIQNFVQRVQRFWAGSWRAPC